METSPKQNIIRLNYNQPIVLTLKYPTGKEVNGTWGKQLLFITGSGHRLYAPPILQHKLKAVGIKAGEKFMLTKARLQNGHGYRVEWQVSRVKPDCVAAKPYDPAQKPVDVSGSPKPGSSNFAGSGQHRPVQSSERSGVARATATGVVDTPRPVTSLVSGNPAVASGKSQQSGQP